MDASLSAGDLELVEAARALIRQRYDPERHVVAAAVRTRSGAVFTGVHLDHSGGLPVRHVP